MAADYFLKIAGIDGESQDSTHKDQIEVLSWSWGESNAGAGGFGGGHGTGKVNMNDFNFVMRYGKASPKLMLACAAGTHIADCVLYCRKAGDVPYEYLEVTFKDVFISSYQTGGSQGGDEYPTDSLSFNFTEVNMQFKFQKEDGAEGTPIKAGYNVKTNKKV